MYKVEIVKLETSLVKLYDCKIDSEFKEGKNEEYNCITKAYIGEEKIESIFYLSLDKEQYKYVSGLDYKNTLFNMKGVIQVRKNKKDIPFIYFKCSYIESLEDIAEAKKKKKEKIGKKQQKIEWISKIPNAQENLVELDPQKIKFVDEIHKHKAMIDIGGVKENYVPKLAVNPIEGTDEYALVFGFRGLILAKMLDLKVMAYVTDCNREELLKQIGIKEKKKKNKKNK